MVETVDLEMFKIRSKCEDGQIRFFYIRSLFFQVSYFTDLKSPGYQANVGPQTFRKAGYLKRSEL